MADFDWRELNKLIADCKQSGGLELDLNLDVDVKIGDDALLYDEVLHVVVQELPDLERLTGPNLYEKEEEALEVLARHAEHLPHLRAISLFVDDCGLQALTAHARLMPLIEVLYLSIGDDGLKTLAAHAEHFSGLRVIDFECCDFGDEGLRALAVQAKHLVSLEAITETDAQLLKVTAKGYAAQLRNLTGLKVLNLFEWPIGNVGLKALASQGKGFAKLESLALACTNVGDDGLKALAAQARHLGNLQHLGLSDTQVGDDGLKALAIEWEAGRLRSLETLDVIRSQVKSVAAEVLETRSAEQIFKAVLDGRALPEAKLVVLGEPGVGKTSLCRRFFRGRVADPSKRKVTQDFELIIPKWRPQVRDLDVKLRVWDFGGQHVLHGTHEMFLTSRSVCLLVLDATQVKEHDPAEVEPERDGNRLSYWLKMILHLVGADAHVILIVTKCDESAGRLQPLDASGLHKEHGFIRTIQVVEGFSATDESREEPVEELRRVIKDSLVLMSDLQRRVSPEFAALKERVESGIEGRPLVNMDEYREWCREVGVTRQQNQDEHLRTLHNFGSIFFFGLLYFEEKWRDRPREWGDIASGQRRLLQAERDSALQRWLINPRWLKKPLYRLIRKSERHSWLREDQIRRVVRRTIASMSLGDPAAAEDVVIGALKLTELCFWDKGRQEYFFPRGLDAKCARFLTGWDEPNRHEATWKWDFFPEAVIHRFIVKALELDEVHADALWRTGAVLKRGETTVAVQSEPEHGKVTVWLKKRLDNDSQPTRQDEKYLYRLHHRLSELIGREPKDEFHSWGSEAANEPEPRAPIEIEDARHVMSSADTAERQPEFVFAHDGEGYFIRAFGVEGHFQNQKGFRQIEQLLRAKDHRMDMLKLHIDTPGKEVKDDAQRSSQMAVDYQALQDSHNRLKEISLELEQAKQDGDFALTSRLETEKDDILQYVKKSTGVAGKSRDLNAKLSETARSSVLSNIKRTACGKLRSASPPMTKLAEHLTQAIRAESPLIVYEPRGDAPQWSLNLPPK